MNIEKQDKFLKLYNPVKKNLDRFALSISNSYDEAKEIVSETVYRAYLSFENLKSDKAFLSFIFSIARRVKYNLYNSNKNLIYYDELPDFLYSNSVNPEDYTEISLLYNSLNKLSELEKEAIILSEINDLPHKEISIIQNTSVVNIKVRIHRAKKKLKKILTDSNFEESYNYKNNSFIPVCEELK